MPLRSYARSLFILLTVAVVSSCGDSTLQEAGGGGGDSDGQVNPVAVALIQPFTGLYDLQDDWNAQAGDEAFLSIREPNANGVAEAVLFDIDDDESCTLSPVIGEVVIDPVPPGDRVFLNDILDLEKSELTLSGTTLTIELEDANDRDGDGDLRELIEISAERVGITEMDLAPSCF